MAQMLVGVLTEPKVVDSRGAVRRRLKLELPAVPASQDTTSVLIRDLSPHGFRIEASAALKVGDPLQIDLPEAGLVEARIVWNKGRSFGCAFVAPVSKAAVSAALLRTPIEWPVEDQEAAPDQAGFDPVGPVAEVSSTPHESMAINWTALSEMASSRKPQAHQFKTATAMLGLLAVSVVVMLLAMLTLPLSAIPALI